MQNCGQVNSIWLAHELVKMCFLDLIHLEFRILPSHHGRESRVLECVVCPSRVQAFFCRSLSCLSRSGNCSPLNDGLDWAKDGRQESILWPAGEFQCEPQ